MKGINALCHFATVPLCHWCFADVGVSGGVGSGGRGAVRGGGGGDRSSYSDLFRLVERASFGIGISFWGCALHGTRRIRHDCIAYRLFFASRQSSGCQWLERGILG
jgi:hypothetical protein